MAQQDDKPTARKERPSSMKLQTSLSEPSPSIEPKSNSRRHRTLPEPLKATPYVQSPAERYVACQSELRCHSNEQADISPETPSSITCASSSHSFQSIMTHAELMQKWHQKKANEICKKQKHRYVYGTPPQSSLSLPTTSLLAFPSRQLNAPLSSPRNDTQPTTRVLKKENATEQSKTNESRRQTRLSSAV